MKEKAKIIALVLPWFGKYCHGGAENFSTRLAGHLAAAGMDMEILTTTARDFTWDWNHNFYRPGEFLEDGLKVRRFMVTPGQHRLFQALVQKINAGLPVNIVQEKNFIENSVRSRMLEQFLRDNRTKYDFFIFAPYLYGTTFFGIEAVPEKSILIGCLHDEPYAHLEIFRRMYQNARALVYLSRPEKELAEKLYGVGARPNIIGGAVDISPAGEAADFRNKFGISGPFLLYSGRKDAGKNIELLRQYFLRYKKENPGDLRLVLIGPGAAVNTGEIIDLGLVSGADKANAMAAAAVLVQPSVHESFSIVIMESWLNGRPVLVPTDSPVTRDFVGRSGGGLYFSNFPEFAESVSYLIQNPAAADKMASAGRNFVLENLSWKKVLPKYLKFFSEISAK